MGFYSNIGDREVRAYGLAESVYKDFHKHIRSQIKVGEDTICMTPNITFINNSDKLAYVPSSLLTDFDLVRIIRRDKNHEFYNEAIEAGKSIKRFSILVIKKLLLEYNSVEMTFQNLDCLGLTKKIYEL